MHIDIYYNVLEKLNQLSETNKHVESETKPEDEVQEHAIAGMALRVGDSPETINNKHKKKKKRTKSPSSHL